ncbi:MAG TPA: hypothetical protein VGE66_16125 [Chitinophagaceae bacterium]
MPEPRPSLQSKRYLKTFLIALGVLVLAITGLQVWFVHNAKGILKDIVTERSQGKVKLELSQLTFNFFSNKLQVRQADLLSVDSTTSPTTYRIQFRRLSLRVASFWPLLLKKQMTLDSIKLLDPRIEVTQWRKDTSTRSDREDLSIPRQMGTLYNSMLDVLETFGIRRIQVANASVSLINKMKPATAPVTITGIYFNLVRTPELVVRRDEFVQDKQTLDLRTDHQDIVLPGGRHRLSFKKFNLELFRKRIQLDSCTVTAIATDSTRSSYAIFFNKLMLVGVDFNAMYRYNLIRADSVYCENPLFDINLYAGAQGPSKKGRPDPEKIVQELTGDLDLAFVGVKDAGIHIDIAGRKSRTLFNSNKDNFELRGLRINADSSQPVMVDRFDMLVQDYRLYNEDSSAAYSFDSVRFENRKISLSNFSVTTETSRQMVHNYRDFKIPYFVLTGMDWYTLIFEQSLKAEEALLVNPDIRYVKTKSAPRRRTNFFDALQSADRLMTLDKVAVLNGRISMELGPSVSVSLNNVDMSLLSNRLLQSTNDVGLRRAVERLSFSDGVVQFKDITARFTNAKYTGRNLLYTERLVVDSRSGKIAADARNVYLDNLILAEGTDGMVVDGVRWSGAKVDIEAVPGNRESQGNFTLHNIAANNTDLTFSSGHTKLQTFVQALQFHTLDKKGTSPLRIEGLRLAGRDLRFGSGPMQLRASSYNLASGELSRLSGLKLERIDGADSLSVATPRLSFTADINNLLAGDLHLQHLAAESPVVRMRRTVKSEEVARKPLALRIDRVAASEPDIHIINRTGDSATVISLPHSEGSALTASGLVIGKEGLKVGSLSANTTSATFAKANGEVIGVEKGAVDFEFSNLELGRREGRPYWGGTITKLSVQSPNTLTFGKSGNRLLIEQATVGNISLSSESFTSFDRMLRLNVSAWLRTATGQYIDSTTTLKWYNAGYNADNKTLSLDSFTYHPTQSRDTVVARAPYQTDYITFKSGPVTLTDFNLDDYKRDSALIANTVTIDKPVITIYRDKLPPRLTGVIKPLPVDMIKRIKLPLSLGNVVIIDGSLSYTERHPKTRAEGTIVLNSMSGVLTNIKNHGHSEKDSLSLTLSAFLMDSAELNLRVRESYVDSLAGFLMTLRVKPTTLTFLNPVLAPLSNVIITSGTIDSLQLRAIGQENLSLGEMNMFYRNLRIRLVKDGAPTRSSFTDKVASFLANALVIRTNNNGKPGIVYFERLRDRSFFNYIIKMTFSGMATSIGVKSNKKYIRNYVRALRQRALPPIDFLPE